MSPRKSLLQLHSAVLLFGFAGLFGKWLVFSPLLIVAGRVFFASLTLAVVLLFFKKGFRVSPCKDIGILLVLGFILAGHWASFFQSIQISSVAVGLLSYSTFPVFTVFLEPLFFHERINKANIFYSILCFTGVFFIIPKFSVEEASFMGVVWGLVSGFSFALLAVYNRKLTQRHSSLIIAFYQDLFASLFLIPSFFFIPVSLSLHDILLLFILGTFCTAASHSLFIHGMRRIQAQTASLISTLEPVYGIVLAVFFLQEIPSVRIIFGGAFILMSQILIAEKFFK